VTALLLILAAILFALVAFAVAFRLAATIHCAGLTLREFRRNWRNR